jgi:signal transduction histidine kinase
MTHSNNNEAKIGRLSFYLIISASCVAALLLVQLLFFSLQFLHAESLKQSLHSVLRNEINMKEPYRIAQSVNDLEALGLFRCSALSEESKDLVFQSLKFRQVEGACEQSFLLLNGISVNAEVLSISGQRWNLSFLSSNPVSFYVFLWITRAGAVFSILMLTYFLNLRHAWRISRLQLESRHALELSAQAAQVAHDIKSPLAVISQVDRGNEVHERALVRLKQLIGRLSGITEVEPGTITFKQLIQESFEEKFFEIGSSVQFSLDADGAEEIVLGDVFQWRRVLSNLFNNSIEAAPAGRGVRIDVEFSVDGELGQIQIRDNGKGIPSNVLPKIKNKGGTFGKANGNGLGISSAVMFLESIGGQLEIESEEGFGTTVTLTFPIAASRDVILVDDDPLIADLWMRAAKKRGVPFSHFNDPEVFLQSLGALPRCALIYLDVHFDTKKFDIKKIGQLIRDAGMANIFIATGYPKDQFQDYSWASGVVGKEPPFV